MNRPKLKQRLNILVTAGPTRESLDPVRFICNYSTGYFGYAVAKEARRRGHRVILISGPTALAKPKGVRCIGVVSARQMGKRINQQFGWCDCLVMSAAICDFRPQRIASRKIKRTQGRQVMLRLRQNPDILKGLGRKKGSKLLVGFALETEGLLNNAQAKLTAKNLDLIVATQMKLGSYPFGANRLSVLMLDKTGRIQRFNQAAKARLSTILVAKIEGLATSLPGA